ncbi:origin recognition complex subunit 4 [Wolffia australiana]
MVQKAAIEASVLLRRRLCDRSFIFDPLKSSADGNYRNLKFIISSTIIDACNNSVLLLGPRGSGKNAVLELVLEDLKTEYPGTISVIRLNGLLHTDDNHGIKEIARQLCVEHGLLFSKMASSDDNSTFLIDILRESGLAHKTVVFILDEFDLFAQGKQRLLYGLLDALQSFASQSVVIGVSCRLDADQLLEKRVRSRFSHRKLLFVPPSVEEIQRLMEHLLYLPADFGAPCNFVSEFNSRLSSTFVDKKFKDILASVCNVDGNVSNLVRFLFCAVASMNLESGSLSLENFKTASLSLRRMPKLENIQNTSILELYLLVCMCRLEVKEQSSYNFITIMKEYRVIHDAYKSSDHHGDSACLRAFEHLLQRELISFTDGGRRGALSIEYRPVKLLVSSHELHQGLKSYHSCPVILEKLLSHETYK